MKALLQLVYKVFGMKFYLRRISKTYITLISWGMLKKKYPEIFYLKELIRPRDCCLDIGGNLGYYSTMMAKCTGIKGKVIAFEPIPAFAEVFRRNTRKFPQIQLQQVALGQEEKKVKMAISMKDGVIQHGLTKVLEEDHEETSVANFDVMMVKGDDVMQHHYSISKIDFIKCDGEGYEQFVMPSFLQTISHSLPTIQIELNGRENRENVVAFLTGLGYEYKILKKNTLVDVAENDIFDVDSYYYFIPPSKKEPK